ncbi:tandem C2 domains nuclear protein isoform X2 [Mugil cephalus]|uniref:tandem C2 domains nuclear protein isoform X2 n=1 Tax=Mugil cephalus TaxID=48193 RepID=UPI001FB5A512|nr:tandem C2 domains nuclear protein isoform X2 [Mugil cephalus]
MECLKNCCKNFMKKQEPETQVIKVKMPPHKAVGSGHKPGEGGTGATDDYLLSKMPPDGRDVPFVLPTFKPTYIQPKGPQYSNSPAGSIYAERKAALQASSRFVYSPESSFHQGQLAAYVSPGSSRRDTLKNRNSRRQSPGVTLNPGGQQRLSSSMFDLSSAPGHTQQRLDSTSSNRSSLSSMIGSMESSLESIALSGDEREMGKVCVRLRYEEPLEQVWITLVQCSDLSLHLDTMEQQRISFKAIITTPKPTHFKTMTKDYSEDVSLMETFVFVLRLHQLRCSSLVLRLQTHNPRKRTVAECVLSLRQLGPQETEHWLELNPPSKSSVSHSELQLATCFQPVNGRIQLQVLAAQNLPASSSPLTQAFFVKVEMHQLGQVVMKKKTKAVKASAGQCRWTETFHLLLSSLNHACSLTVKLYSRSSVRRKQCLGQVHLGLDSPVPQAVEQWKDLMAHPEKVVSAWYRLSSS